DTPPNCLAAFPSSKEVDAVVVSTPISIVNPSAQIRFKNYYSTEAGYDGAVLEVKIGSGVFEDVIAAGGTFVSRGYSGVIDGRATSSIAGRSAWTGSSGGNYVLTVISLPPAVAGQTIQLRFRWTSNDSIASDAWNVDTVEVDR